MSLWRFEFFVEGKHLEQVMEAISGVALNFQPPQPVGNATVQRGKVKAQTTPVKGVGLEINQALKALPQNTSMSSEEFTKLIVKLGANKSSYSHFIQGAIKAGLMKPRGRGHYVITNGETLNGQG